LNNYKKKGRFHTDLPFNFGQDKRQGVSATGIGKRAWYILVRHARNHDATGWPNSMFKKKIPGATALITNNLAWSM
jgi:hypothetical protein